MTAQLLPAPIFKGWDNNGNPLANGQLFTYQAGTTTPQASYTDATQSQPQTNPVILNARGEASVWLDPALTYKLVLQDSQGNFIWSQDQVVGGYIPVTQLASYVTQTFIGQTLFPRTATEIALNIFPTSYAYPQGEPRRYGVVGDGITDDTAALNVWSSVGGLLSLPALTYLISAPITFPSYARVQGTIGAIVTTVTPNISHFACNSVTGVVFRNVHFKQTGGYGNTAYTLGQVLFNLSTFCTVSECIFEGAQWSGVTMYGCTDCTARNNYFTGFVSGTQDQADIALISTPSQGPSSNVVDGNFCFGGGQFGVSIEDPYVLVAGSRNVITNNRIGQHTGYGILVYQPAGGDTYNEIIGNHIESITGTFAVDGTQGAGIYMVNGIGGGIVANNVIRNCCINTTSATLAPAGIGVSGSASVNTPLVISGNVIQGMTNYWGILATGMGSGVTITGNTIRMPATQTNIGGGIRVTNSANVSVTGNQVTLLTTSQNQDGITAFAQGASCGNVSIVGNTITGGHANQIRIGQSGGNTVTGVVIDGNVCTGGDSSCIPLSLDSTAASRVTVSANQFIATGSVAAMTVTSCITVRMTNNALSNAGGALVTFSGTNTSSGFVHGQINAGQVSNSGTGLICETLQTAVPASGTYAVGDIVRNSTPAAAGVLYWVCTTAGTPGTFKTVSNT